jgi:hypothetical protein
MGGAARDFVKELRVLSPGELGLMDVQGRRLAAPIFADV